MLVLFGKDRTKDRTELWVSGGTAIAIRREYDAPTAALTHEKEIM